MIRKISARHGIGGNFSDLTQLPDKKLHPPVAAKHFERISTGGAAHRARVFCPRKIKSDKITFSNSKLLSLKKLKKTSISLIL